jgi:hypothetical protein
MPQRPQGNIAPQIDQTYLMMATADLYNSNLLFEQRAEPVAKALASGTTDIPGEPTTIFDPSKVRK